MVPGATPSRMTHHIRDGLQKGLMVRGSALDVTGQVDCQGMGSLAIQQAVGQLLGIVPLLWLYLHIIIIIMIIIISSSIIVTIHSLPIGEDSGVVSCDSTDTHKRFSQLVS